MVQKKQAADDDDYVIKSITTPGPWEVVNIGHQWFVVSGDITIATVHFPDIGGIASNAELIAAAPQMFMALAMGEQK